MCPRGFGYNHTVLSFKRNDWKILIINRKIFEKMLLKAFFCKYFRLRNSCTFQAKISKYLGQCLLPGSTNYERITAFYSRYVCLFTMNFELTDNFVTNNSTRITNLFFSDFHGIISDKQE